VIRKHLAAALALVAALASPAWAGAYVRLSEIAERYGLEPDVDLITGRTVLSDGRNKVALVPGGYQILVNGRFTALTERVGCERGDLIVPVAALDALERHLEKRATQPVVVAAPARPATTVPTSLAAGPSESAPASVVMRARAGTIVLDAGHGGAHTGARGRGGLLEKDVTLAICEHMRPILEARGWKVVMTRADDRHLSKEINQDLDARCALANRADADVFVSVHANYAETSSAQGYEIYCAPGRPRDAALAQSIRRSFQASVDDEDRGVKNAGFRVIKRTKAPAVLVEVGFISHPPTERRLASDAHRKRIAEVICRGIDRWSASGRVR
jgi:N-acetylmuramoyl-L-alanine amidase CwlD